MLTIEELRQLRGNLVLDTGGQQLGTIEDLYADRADETPTFATVLDAGGGHAFVPLAEARLVGDAVEVPYSVQQLSTAPFVSKDAELTPEEEAAIYTHYGLAGPAPSPQVSAVPATSSDGRRHANDEAAVVPAGATPRTPRANTAGSSASQAAGVTASAAKDEAARTAQTAASAAGDVAETAREEVGKVAGEAVDQVRQLADQARSQAAEQADQATQALSHRVRALAGETRDLSRGQTDGSGAVAGLAAQLADAGEQLADYLAQQGPGGVVQEVRGFAARRPGAFLLGALAAGVVTGRLVKGATAGSSSPTGERADVAEAVPVPVSPYPVEPVRVADSGGPDDVSTLGPPPGERVVDVEPERPRTRRARSR
jgi:hypothetical protein